MAKEAFGARTYLVGQILAGALARADGSNTFEQLADSAIELADLTIHKMGQKVVHPWEKTDATVPAAEGNQDEAAL